MIIKQLSTPATATPQPTTFFCNHNTINYVVDTYFAINICISMYLMTVNRQPVNLLLFSTKIHSTLILILLPQWGQDNSIFTAP